MPALHLRALPFSAGLVAADRINVDCLVLVGYCKGAVLYQGDGHGRAAFCVESFNLIRGLVRLPAEQAKQRKELHKL